MEDCSSSHKYIKIDCDMRKFSNQCCHVNVDMFPPMATSLLRPNRPFWRPSHENSITNINHSMPPAWLRLLSSFIHFSLACPTLSLHQKASNNHSSNYALIHCPLGNRTPCSHNNADKNLSSNWFLCVWSTSSYLLSFFFSKSRAPQVMG